VRQAAGAYVLAEYHLDVRDDRVARALEAALTTFGNLSLPISKGALQSVTEHLGVLSLPLGRYKLRDTLDRLQLLYRRDGDGRIVSGDTSYGQAWAGATALALLAELQYHRATGDNRFEALRTAWLKGLMVLHVPGGGFRPFPDSIDDSPYVDGEAWLALAYYASIFPRDRDLAALLRTIDGYMTGRYGRVFSPEFYHWGTMAAGQRWQDTQDPKFLSFIRDQARVFLDRPERKRDRLENTCSGVEGLASVAAALRRHDTADSALLQRIRDRIAGEMAKNRSLQIQPRQERLQFGDGRYLFSPRLRDFGGAFLAGIFSPYTRIDITSHCLSAMTKLQRQ
jgi:hypothetical protein